MPDLQGQSNSLKKKIQMQNMIILALAIIIIVLIVVSSTAAWYIRTKSDSADIILSNPVNIYITEFTSKETGGVEYHKHEIVTDILENYKNRIYPGDRIKLKLGMQIGTEKEESSPAYLRVKLSMAFSKISDDPNEPIIELEDLANQRLIEYENKPNAADWVLIDFADPDGSAAQNPDHVPDYWYVYKTTDNLGRDSAKIAPNLQTLEFINGYIKLSKTEITNKHANCKFHIQYSVEAIQIVNVPDPLTNRGYGPWWNFALGDIEDINS